MELHPTSLTQTQKSKDSMFPSSNFCSFLGFMYSALVALQCATATTIQKQSHDIINQTCKTCTQIMPSNLSYEFCSSSLAAVPVSHFTSLGGLGLITLELALENATSTLLTINNMLSRNETTYSDCDSCLKSCQKSYSKTSAELQECIVGFMSGEHAIVYLWVSAMVQATATCEDGFEGKGLQSPLTRENYYLSQLCDIVLCIIDLIHSATKSRPSALS